MKLFRTTKEHSKYWRERKIDWKTSYLDTWNHPHRAMLSQLLKKLRWSSLFEVGCGSGPNLARIVKDFPSKQLGGCDVNADAVEMARNTFDGGHFKVGPANNLMMSDNSVDIILSDMALIYVSDIHKTLNEMIRVGRHFVVLCELHSDNWWNRFRLKWESGYHAYNYKKLLGKHGLHDITLIKIPPEVWDGKPQKPFGYFILARIPKHKHEYHNPLTRSYRAFRGL